MTTTAKPLRDKSQPIKLYRAAISGHSHRVELFLSLLGLPFEMVEVNVAKGEQKTPEFLAMNPFGQIPVLQDGDVTLSDSNAILVYLQGQYAPGRWMPREPLAAAKVQRWLSVAAGPLAYGAAAARVNQLFKRPTDPQAIARGEALFALMEDALGQSKFLAGGEPTLADLANYAYVARAPEGKVSLDPYPNVRAWLERIEALPRFVPMVKTPAS
jgi:glutathione S-transferase